MKKPEGIGLRVVVRRSDVMALLPSRLKLSAPEFHRIHPGGVSGAL